MEKRLEFKLADVSTYVYEGYPVAIMSLHGDKHKEWMLSNYIQLNCRKNIIEDKYLFLAFYDDIAINSPFIKKEHFCWSLLSKYDLDLVSFFKKNIDLGCYLYFKIDEYYIPHRVAYNNNHFIHDNLVIGYGEDYFIVVGYDDAGLCSEKKISIKDFMQGLRNNKPDIDKNEWKDSIYFMRYADADYKFNINLVKNSLREFLDSEGKMDQIKRYSNPLEDTVFGMEVYDKILEYMDTLIEVGNIFLCEGIDNRIFRCIMEHKKLMLERIKMIEQKIGGVDDLIVKYEKTSKLASSLHFLAIKYNISPNDKLLYDIRSRIQQIQQEDRILLEELYNRI